MTTAELQHEFGKNRAIFCHCDVTDYGQFEESFQVTKETFGKIDILVNNAEIQNDKFWELETDINLVCNMIYHSMQKGY